MSRAILRYLGKTTIVEGETLYPTDPNEALIVDESKYKFPSLFYFRTDTHQYYLYLQQLWIFLGKIFGLNF